MVSQGRKGQKQILRSAQDDITSMGAVGAGVNDVGVDRLLGEVGAVDALDGFVIATEKSVPSDDGDVLQHSGSISQVADAGALVVSPAYGDFDDAVTALASDEENLWVEAPALDGLELEDGLRGGAGEGFEAALRVGIGQTHDGAGDGIEAAAEELAVERLANGLARALEPAGADGDVSSGGDGGDETVRFLNGRGEVGVSEHDPFSERVKNAVADAITLSMIARILKHADLRVFGGEGIYDGGRFIARAIVNHDNFGAPAALVDAGKDRLQRAPDAGGLVICGDDDAVLRVAHLAVGGTPINLSYDAWRKGKRAPLGRILGLRRGRKGPEKDGRSRGSDWANC